LPWCIGGDFNVTRFPNERFGEARLSSVMTDFSYFSFDHGLMDLLLVALLLGRLLLILLCGLGLIVFLFPMIGKFGFHWFLKRGFHAFIRTTSQSSLIVVVFQEGAGLSNLKTCGLKQKVFCGSGETMVGFLFVPRFA